MGRTVEFSVFAIGLTLINSSILSTVGTQRLDVIEHGQRQLQTRSSDVCVWTLIKLMCVKPPLAQSQLNRAAVVASKQWYRIDERSRFCSGRTYSEANWISMRHDSCSCEVRFSHVLPSVRGFFTPRAILTTTKW